MDRTEAWLAERRAMQASNRVHLKTLKDHIERMEAANEEFSLEMRHITVVDVLTRALKTWTVL